MADIPLKSFTFPGLSDKYTTPVVDNTLAVAGAAADAKKTGDEISGLKNDLTQGTFPVGNAENASQLTSTVGIEDNAPYLFRTSGGSNDIGDREDVKKIVGGTLANNQQIKVPSSDLSKTENGVTITDNRDGTFTVSTDANGATADVYLAIQSVTITEGHKYTLLGTPSSGSSNTYYGYVTGGVLGLPDTGNGTIYIGNTTQSGTFVPVYVKSGTIITVPVKFAPKFCDLTQMLGATIADYVYSLHQATAGAGVAWLKKHFPAQFDSGYQAYDAGSLQSVSGLTAHKMIGFNQWDEEWELGVYDTNTGAPASVNTNIRSKSTNYIPVVPGTVYYFNTAGKLMEVYQYRADKSYIGKFNVTDNTATLDVACCFLRFDVGSSYGTTYNHDICINFHWDGEKDGTYEPYKTWSYALDDSVTLRGIPKVDANGNLYYDGDEYLPDGTVNRRYGIVDLGTLNWEAISGYAGCFKAETTEIINTPNGIIANALCPKYVTVKGNELSTKDKAISVGMNNAYQIQISDSAHSASSASDFKTAMSGVMLLYEKRLPTTETASPYQETQIVDDFGTEEFVLADTAFPVPVGHDTWYQNNLRAKLEMSPESPDGDGLYVVQQESGQNEYVPLASTSTIQDILTRLTALENA